MLGAGILTIAVPLLPAPPTNQSPLFVVVRTTVSVVPEPELTPLTPKPLSAPEYSAAAIIYVADEPVTVILNVEPPFAEPVHNSVLSVVLLFTCRTRPKVSEAVLVILPDVVDTLSCL